MKIYIAYKFSGQNLDKLKEELLQIDQVLKELGHQTFIFSRDVQHWKTPRKPDNQKILDRALKELQKCDCILVEATNRGSGQGIEAGYAKALGKKVIVIAKKGTEVRLMKALADKYVEYNKINDLKKKLRLLNKQKISKKEAIKIINEFIKNKLNDKSWYKKIKPYTKAIVLYGSVAKGLNRPNSDIDVLIFIPLKIEKKYTKGEYFYHYKNQEINLVLRSIEKFRKLAKEQNDSFQAEIFQDSEIIWQKDNEVKKLVERIRKVKR